MEAIKLDTQNNHCKSNEEMEEALNLLMEQFRQIDEKYGLMVVDEINSLFDQTKRSIVYTHGFMKTIEKRQK